MVAALLASWVVFPLVMLALVVGCGLLAERAAGSRMPGALVAPTGLAVLIVIGGFCTLSRATAPLTTPAAARSLCGKRLDWIEAVHATRG